MEEYIERHIDPEPRWLARLYRDANRNLLYTRMMSGHLQGRFLKMLTEMIGPLKVLELGTFAGYSTLCMAEGLKPGAVIDTVEVDDELEPFLREHFDASPFPDRISLHIGDAMEVVPALASDRGKWNMVFIDADKRRYPDYYEMILPLVEKGGWIIADNTLWNGRVAGSDTGQPGKSGKDAQLAGILEFNRIVAGDERVEKVILPLRDGLTIIHVKE